MALWTFEPLPPPSFIRHCSCCVGSRDTVATLQASLSAATKQKEDLEARVRSLLFAQKAAAANLRLAIEQLSGEKAEFKPALDQLTELLQIK